LIVRERSVDQSELDAYAQVVGPILEGLPIKFLAANGAKKCLKDRRPRGTVV